jgi:hypothetical protein
MKYLVLVAAFVAVTFSPASAKSMGCKKAPCTYHMSVQRIQTDTAQRIKVRARDPFRALCEKSFDAAI